MCYRVPVPQIPFEPSGGWLRRRHIYGRPLHRNYQCVRRFETARSELSETRAKRRGSTMACRSAKKAQNDNQDQEQF